MTVLAPCRSCTAICGTRIASDTSSVTARTRPNWPGHSTRWGLGTSARTWMVPVFWSIAIHEDRPALLRKHAAVGQDQLERGRAILRHLAAPEPRDPLDETQVVRLRDREVHVHWIDRRDRGQQRRLALADEVTRVDVELAEDAVD